MHLCQHQLAQPLQVGNQMPSSHGGGVYGGGSGGALGSSSHYCAPGSGGYGGYGVGSYRPPANSGGTPSGGGYPDSGHYRLPSSAYQSQNQQPTGSSTGQRFPGGGAYPNVPHYYKATKIS